MVLYKSVYVYVKKMNSVLSMMFKSQN